MQDSGWYSSASAGAPAGKPGNRPERAAPPSASFRQRALVIMAVYALVATLWIYLSDHALAALAPDADTFAAWSVYKGVGFVAVTAALLLGLMWRAFGETARAHAELQQSERRLAASQAQLAAIIRAAGDAIVTLGPHGHILMFNEAAEALFQCSREQAMGKRLDQFLPGADRVEANTHLETQALRPDGTSVPVETAYSRVAMERGPLSTYIVRDISQRRRAEVAAAAERRFSSAVIERLPGVVCVLDDRGRLLRWNRNLEQLTGLSAAALSESDPSELYAPEQRLLVREQIERVLTEGEAHGDALLVAANGQATPYFVTAQRVQLDDQDCIVAIGLDVSEQRQAEQALRDLNERLEVIVAERTQKLESAVERAERADRLKSAFLATMSHELRTPLNSIIGFTGILLQELAGPLTDEQRKQLGMVRSSSRHLLSLINDILDLSRIEADQLTLTPEHFTPADSIRQLVETLQPAATAKGLALSADLATPLPAMYSDRRRFEQILLNLLNNAIKFTRHGSVQISARILRDQVTERPGNDWIQIEIADTGIGIQETDLELLFQPFQQVDTGLARQHEGTGLGLAICRRLATLLGGAVNARSRYREGSVFTVTLPVELPAS